MAAFKPRKPSRILTEKDAATIKQRLKRGDLQSRIAADYDVNGGRISEINTGKRFPNVIPANDDTKQE